MPINDLSWTTPKKIPVYGREWVPDTAPRAVIVLGHGIGEHIGRYEKVAQMFISHNYAFIASDLTGHGKSGGQRGHVDSIDDFYVQIDWMIQTARSHFPDCPVFLYGHSLGSSLYLQYLEDRVPAVQGAILCSPALEITRVPPLKRWLGNVMYALYPRMKFTNSLDVTGLSRDPSVVEDYKKDPMVHDLVSARLGIDLLNSPRIIHENKSRIKTPILLMQGSADRLVNATGSREFVKNFKGELKYVEIPDAYHELHNEPNKEEVFKVWLDWLDERIQAGKNQSRSPEPSVTNIT